ncbi:MAG: protein tyrosine phosphatase [Methylobacterium mesophilicum]|nr:protein tyrosine phosphatase [Methylobacterium mesophilicum]
MILVAPRSAVERLIAEHRPGALVSLRSPDAALFSPALIPCGRQLHLVMNDIAEDRPGLVSPTEAQVRALLDFMAEWDRARPLLIHCYAGISRSTAAAFIAMAALYPGRDEGELAAELRALSPSATPNPYLIRLADALLGRDGRMVHAVERIGRGAEAFEGTPFAW